MTHFSAFLADIAPVGCVELYVPSVGFVPDQRHVGHQRRPLRAHVVQLVLPQPSRLQQLLLQPLPVNITSTSHRWDSRGRIRHGHVLGPVLRKHVKESLRMHAISTKRTAALSTVLSLNAILSLSWQQSAFRATKNGVTLAVVGGVAFTVK